MNVFLCSTGFEDALIEESQGKLVCPGVVMAERGDDFVFARQILPNAVAIQQASISKLAAAALAHIRVDRSCRVDAIVADDPSDPNLPGELARRVGLIADEVRDRLRKKLDEGPLVVQLLLAARDELYVSVAELGEWPVRFPAGRVAVADDWAAPSSAFRKLEEALAWLGDTPKAGELCVDLGAAPGGWSHVALERGARVIAVDRADLDPRIRAEHIRRDGFSYVPERPADWLLCDIIATPQKSLALLEKWLANGWANNLVFHLKFKGRADYALAQKARALHPRLRVKHLFHDRNEVTVMARGLLA